MRFEHFEEISGVVIARDHNHGGTRVRKAHERLQDKTERREGRRGAIEEVACDRDQIYLTLLGDTNDLVEDALRFPDPVDPSQLLADVPVRGMEDLQWATSRDPRTDRRIRPPLPDA